MCTIHFQEPMLGCHGIVIVQTQYFRLLYPVQYILRQFVVQIPGWMCSRELWGFQSADKHPNVRLHPQLLSSGSFCSSGKPLDTSLVL